MTYQKTRNGVVVGKVRLRKLPSTSIPASGDVNRPLYNVAKRIMRAIRYH